MYLGINLGHHDTSVGVITEEGELLVLEEERFSKRKQAGFYPSLALDYIKHHFDLNQLPGRNVAFSTFFTNLPTSWGHISDLKSKYLETLIRHPKVTEENKEARYILHHEAHLFSALLNLDPHGLYLIVISDGCGSRADDLKNSVHFPLEHSSPKELFESMSVYSYSQGKLQVLEKFLSPVYLLKGENPEFSPASHFTAASQLIFGDWQYSGKVMGLAGHHKGETYSDDELFKILTTTPFNQKTSKDYFDHLDQVTMERFIKVAGSTQAFFESYMMNYFRRLKEKYPSFENLVYLGGTALNCIFNEKLRKTSLFKTISVPAWTNDEGIGIGAAVGCYYQNHGKLPEVSNKESPFLGVERKYTEEEVHKAFEGYKIKPMKIEEVAGLIAQNEIIPWFEGRSECGPRALGHRSIFCSPFIPGIRDYLNDKIKLRERFRPYGGSVLQDQQEEYFERGEDLYSPFMSFAPVVKTGKRELLKEVMHADGTFRIQTVDQNFPTLKKLLEELRKKTGHSLIIHTSLNINKQPILETIEDAAQFFKESELRYFVFNEYLISK